MESIRKFLRDEEGVTAIEYGLIAGLIGVFIIAAVTGAGEALDLIFDTVADELNTAAGGTAG